MAMRIGFAPMRAAFLLVDRLEDLLVLGKGGAEHPVHLRRGRLVAEGGVAQMRPVVDRVILGHRRHEVQGKDPDTLVAVVLGQLARRIDAAEVDDGRRGQVQVVIMPAVDVAGEASERLEEPDRFGIADPAPGDDGGAARPHMDRHVLGGRVAERRRVDEAHMRRIDEVFGDIEIVRPDVQLVAVMQVPVGVTQFGQIEHRGGVGPRRIAHPDPDDAMRLVHRKGIDIGRGRQVVLPRHAHASARAVEGHAMIAALDRVADPLAAAQRQLAVRATVLERHDPAVRGAEHHQVLRQDRERRQRLAEIRRPAGDVPGILHEGHDPFPQTRQTRSNAGSAHHVARKTR